MHVEVIDTVQELRQLKRNWNAVYEADPEAQFFLSWTWMSRWLTAIGDRWFVLTAKPDPGAAGVAFFPLRWRSHSPARGSQGELTMAGNRGADYTGFICAPEYQEQVIPAFARFIGGLDWSILNLEFIRASDRRLSLFLRSLAPKDLQMREILRASDMDHVDLCRCPYVQLPDSWEAYLAGLSANTRQRIRRFLRQVDSSGEFRITRATIVTMSDDLAILLRLWKERWGERKGEAAASIERIIRVMCMHCAAQEQLFLPVLWKGNTPIGATANFIDPQKKSLLFYVGARDCAATAPPPGFVLHAHSIRYAIRNGFSTYDFLRGNEPYKYAFGAAERRIRHVIVDARRRRDSAGSWRGGREPASDNAGSKG